MMPKFELATWLSDECSAIQTALAAACAERNARLYAIIDLAILDDAPSWLTWLRGATGARNLFEDQPEARVELLAPWLIPIPCNEEAQARVIGATVVKGLQCDCVTWLVSNLDTSQLAPRLSRRLTARLSEGNALFRYYDPRLLPIVHEMWDESGQPGFFQLGHVWGYLNDSRELQWVALNSSTVADPLVPPVRIAPQMRDALQIASEQYQLARFLAKRRSGIVSEWGTSRTMAFIREHDALARDKGLEAFAERLNFCVQALGNIMPDESAAI